jgi:hypothetical protein
MTAMPDTVMRWMARAAFIGALGTPADAADLSPPSPSHHGPHGLVGHLPRAPSDHVPAVAPGRVVPRSEADEHAGNPVLNWGANTTFDGPSVRFTTDPSGVIGGTLPGRNNELSPNWLNWQ